MVATARAVPGEPWAIVLAGGEGLRLRPLTRQIAGDDRPKQFCRILDRDTLLEQTRRRIALAVPPEHTLIVLNQAHEPYYAPLLGDVPPGQRVVAPANRGTAPAVLHAVLRARVAAPLASVGIFPSDHYVSDDAAFMTFVEAAFGAVDSRPDLIVLLGVVPDTPEAEYGWIEPGDPVAATGGALRRVRRFREKPAIPVARALRARGCLWNSFIMVGAVSAFLHLVRSAMPDLVRKFATVGNALGTRREPEVVRKLYAQLPSLDFSREVLASRPANLAVLTVTGVAWSDWGSPRRVVATLAALGIEAPWSESWAREPA